ALIDVELHLAVGQRADIAAILLEVRDIHHAGGRALGLVPRRRRPGAGADLAEHAAETHLRLRRKPGKAAHDQHQMATPGGAQEPGRSVLHRTREIEADDLGTERLRERYDMDRVGLHGSENTEFLERAKRGAAAGLQPPSLP